MITTAFSTRYLITPAWLPLKRATMGLFGIDFTPGFNAPSVGDVTGFNDALSTADTNLNNVPYSVTAPTPTTTSTGTAGGGGGGGGWADYTQQTAPSDPYAQWGGQTIYNNLLDSLHTQKQNIQGSANDWAKNYGVGLGGSIADYINNLKQGQQGIDERGVQNELAYNQGRSGILGMVSRGIRSGGVMLANRNAADSSAAGALANAYGEIGRGQLSNIGNQRAIENRNIDIAQGNFNTQAQAGARRIQDSETTDVAGAVSQARDKLAALDAWAADKSLPERIQIEQEKAAIQNQIQDALSKYNDQLGGWKNVKPTSLDERRATANDLANQGTVAANPFDFNANTPLQFQNSPFSSNLPLFLNPSTKKKE